MTDQQNLDQNNNDNAASEAAAGPTPGQLLKAAREQRNLEAKDIAERLRLRLQIIELIEADDYESFASATFVKGYLRSYARVMELNEAEVFAAYERMGFEEPSTIDMQSFSRQRKNRANDNRIMLISYIILAVVIGSAIVWWVQQPNLQFSANDDQERSVPVATDRERDEQPARADDVVAEGDGEANSSVESNVDRAIAEINERRSDAERVGDEAALSGSDPAPVTEDEVDASNDTSTALSRSEPELDQEPEPASTVEQDTESVSEEPVEETIDSANENGRESAVATNEPEPLNDPTPTTLSIADADLVLEFEGECWVRIDDASGETIAFGVKPAGYTMPLDGEAPYSLILGSPEVVSITYQGDEIDMSQFRAGRVARFNLPLDAE